MKKFTTLLVFSIFAVSVYAYGPQTKLSISSFNSYALRIIVDNNTYSFDKSKGDPDFVLSDLAAGNHRIQIYRMPVRPRRGGFGNNAIRVIYDATIYLRAQYFTDIMINRFGRVFKDDMLIDQYTENPKPQQYPKPPRNPNNPQQSYPGQGYNTQMAPQSFEALKATLRNEGFDNSRLNIAKQAAAANIFSAAQVKEVMQLFSFDESRLDIAKTFYPRTIDKGNYFTVSDAFTFSNSKDALMEFIRQNP